MNVEEDKPADSVVERLAVWERESVVPDGKDITGPDDELNQWPNLENGNQMKMANIYSRGQRASSPVR